MIYYFVVLCVDKNKKYVSVHRIVAEHFCDNPNGYKVVNHLDADTLNNVSTNLEWTTTSGNSIHGFRFGFRKGQIGSDNPNTKITKEQVLEIKKLWSMGNLKQKELGEKFGVKQTQISRIVNNKRWKHLITT